MSWNLLIKPSGSVLSNFYKTSMVYSENSISETNVTFGSVDSFQDYNQNSNTVDISFTLDLIAQDPFSSETKPDIVGINYIIITNDSSFNDIFIINSLNFGDFYSSDKNYEFNLSPFSVDTLSLPKSENVIPVESSGDGQIKIINWPLSGGSGYKRVFLSINVALSNGQSASFSNNVSIYDNWYVFSHLNASPSKPEVLTNVSGYSSIPLVFKSDQGSDSGISSAFDNGTAVSAWDMLISNGNITRNSDIISDYVLFNNQTPSVSNIDLLPKVFNYNGSNITWSASQYGSFISTGFYNLSSSQNVYFAEINVDVQVTTENYINPNTFVELNITNSNGNTKYLRNQIITPPSLDRIIICSSVDDTTFGTDISYIPSTKNNLKNIYSPQFAKLLNQSGKYILLVELLDETKKIYQAKILFYSENIQSVLILSDFIFQANIDTATNLYFEFRVQMVNQTANFSVSNFQYGTASGYVSSLKNNKYSYLEQSKIFLSPLSYSDKFWTVLNSGSFSGGVELSDTVIQLYNNSNTEKNYKSNIIEIQSKKPIFSDQLSTSVSFILRNTKQIIDIGYSFDSNLRPEDFTYNQLLKSESGLRIPEQTIKYTFNSFLNWSGTTDYFLSVQDLNLSEICSFSTSTTSELFYVSNKTNDASYQPPIKIGSKDHIQTSKTFNVWTTFSGLATNINKDYVTIFNKGTAPLSISTGFSLSTIYSGDLYYHSGFSFNSSSPTQFFINAVQTNATSSVNFVFDFNQPGIIDSAYFDIQYVEPPECPSVLPTFKYSVEYSSDFINWFNSDTAEFVPTFSASTGKIKILFRNISEDSARYVRVRLYKDVGVDFDPTQEWVYSGAGGQTSSNTISNSGRFYFGHTQTPSSESASPYLDQPSLIRVSEGSTYSQIGLYLDFENYNNGEGFVGVGIFDKEHFRQFYTIENIIALNTEYNVTLSHFTLSKEEGYAKSTLFTINGPGFEEISIDVTHLWSDNNYNTWYPIIGSSGNLSVDVNNASFGTIESGVFARKSSYLSAQDQMNDDRGVYYGKHLLYGNLLSPVSTAYPRTNGLFRLNTIQNFSLDNVTYAVKAVSSFHVTTYGPITIDGVFCDACDFVLLVGQNNSVDNGVYQVQNRFWTKKNPLGGSSITEPTVLVEQGDIFSDTLWMRDSITSDWYSNVVSSDLIISDQKLFNSSNSVYNLPHYFKVPVGISANFNLKNNAAQIKIVSNFNGSTSSINFFTPWIEGELLKDNYTNFIEFIVPDNYLSGITTSNYPAIYSLYFKFSEFIKPMATSDSNFILPKYNKEIRVIKNPGFNYLAFNQYKKYNFNFAVSSVAQASTYNIQHTGQQTLQSLYSNNVVIDNSGPTVGILSIKSSDVKSIKLGLSTVQDLSGVSHFRFIQTNPLNNTVFSDWMGISTNSLSNFNDIVVRPSAFFNYNGLATGQPVSGYYNYSLEIADVVGNITKTNSVESFYYESAIVDTQGPTASVVFVDNNYAPAAFTTSSVVIAQLFANDNLTDVKAFRYRILPNGIYSDWVDYTQYTKIYLSDEIKDGVLSIQFQFKDFGNNVYYATQSSNGLGTSLNNQNNFIYTWNIVSRILTGVIFTTIERTTLNGNDILLIGASKNNNATLFAWDGNKLLEIAYPLFVKDKIVSASIVVGNKVLLGTDSGRIFIYEDGIVTGPYAQFKSGETNLPVSSFTIHIYQDEDVEYVYASTLDIPRIFRTSINNLSTLSWERVLVPPVTVQNISILNGGIWSGTAFNYTVSGYNSPATLNTIFNYGIGSVIINSQGSGISETPTLTINGGINGASLRPVLQGYISQLNLLSVGFGYTAGATVIIAPPAPGGVQATGVAITNSLGQVISVALNFGGQGYGYTVLNPSVLITGNLGFGSRAVASATVQYDSIYALDVISSGLASTTLGISISSPGGSVLIPDFRYNIDDVRIVNPGAGYTTPPIYSLNGITTLLSFTVENGSLSSVVGLNTSYTFPLSVTPSISLNGGLLSNSLITFSTSPISFYTSISMVSYSGFTLNDASFSTSLNYISDNISVSFGTSNMISEPIVAVTLTDDALLYNSEGSIYDIQSYNEDIFVSANNRELLKLGYTSGVFGLDKLSYSSSINDEDKFLPYAIEHHDNQLFVSGYNNPLIARVSLQESRQFLINEKENVLIYKPYNFDILSNWQLVKILNKNGTFNVAKNDNYVQIDAQNSIVFYESTKDDLWFNRSSEYSDYVFYVKISDVSGYQSFEVSNFNTTLKVAFTLSNNNLTLFYGVDFYETLEVNLNSVSESIELTFAKIQNNLKIYVNNKIVEIVDDFYIQNLINNPIIKFGNLFLPDESVINGNDVKIFAPNTEQSSSAKWHQIKISFNTNIDLSTKETDYELTIPYVLPGSNSALVLRSIDNNLYAATKPISDNRETTIVNDISSKVFRLNQDFWEDVSGTFESYSLGINTEQILVTPYAINSLNDSFFVTGLTKPIQSRKIPSIILVGLSTNQIFEESDELNLTIIYPNNTSPSGTILNINSNNTLISGQNIYFAPNDKVKVVNLSVGQTSLLSFTQISVTDGISTSSVNVNINPIGIVSMGVSTSFFTAYSNDAPFLNVVFNAKPKTPRTFTMTSSNPAVGSIFGIATLQPGLIGYQTTIYLPSPVAVSQSITFLSNYRSTFGVATANAQPFNLTVGFNTSMFYANQFYNDVLYTASVNKSPVGILTVNINNTRQDLLNTPLQTNILPGSVSTTIRPVIGGASTVAVGFALTSTITGSITTTYMTAVPFFVVNASSDNLNPILGLQTATVTFTLSTAPKNNTWIRNVITNPSGVSMVFPTLSTVLPGLTQTSFSLSTTALSGPGLAITVQGAPYGFNTTPNPGLILVTDFWRIINFSVIPNSIVGGGADYLGFAQSFSASVTLNAGFTTTVRIVSSSPLVDTRNIVFSNTGLISTTQNSYSTSLITSSVVGLALTAIGPSGISSTISGLFVNPFQITSFSTSYVWNGVSTNSPNYLVGGLGATALVNVELNAYPLSTAQTVEFYTDNANVFAYNQDFVPPVLGYATVYPGSFSTSLAVGANYTLTGYSTSVTGRLLSLPAGLNTSILNVQTFPEYEVIFEPVLSSRESGILVSLSSSIPVKTGLALTFTTGESFMFELGSASATIISSYTYGSFGLDTTLVATTLALNSLQTSYITAYSAVSGAFGMGYNQFGELTNRYPVSGAVQGSAEKVYMGISSVLKSASGDNHNLLLDSNFIVYGVGLNNDHQILGTGTTSIFKTLNLGFPVRDIYASEDTSYVISHDNTLYSFGLNWNGSLGTVGFGRTSTPYKMLEDVRLFASCRSAFIAVTHNPETNSQAIYTNWPGLGISAKPIGSLTVNGIARTINNLRVSAVDVGGSHYVVSGRWNDGATGIQSNGVFAWGSNLSYQLGTTANQIFGILTSPNVLLSSSGSLIPSSDIIVADENQTIIYIGNTAYQYGSGNRANQTGLSVGLTPTSMPRIINNIPSGNNVYKIAKSENHYAYVDSAKNVFLSGGANFSPTIISTSTTQSVFLFAQNGITSQRPRASVIFNDFTNGINIFDRNINVSSNILQSATKYSVQPALYVGAAITNYYGGFAVLQSGPTGFYTLYRDSDSNTIGIVNRSTADSVLDVSISAPYNVDSFNIGIQSTLMAVLRRVGQVNYRLNTIVGISSGTSLPNFTYSGRGSVNITSLFPTSPNLIEVGYMAGYKRSTYFNGSIDVNWNSVLYNIIVANDAGRLTFYGNIDNTNNITKVFSFTYSFGNTITLLKTVMNRVSPNTTYLYVCSVNGLFTVYPANGNNSDSIKPIKQITLSPTYGYAKFVEVYSANIIAVITQNSTTGVNWLLLCDMVTLDVLAASLMPGNVTSLNASTATTGDTTSSNAVRPGTPVITTTVSTLTSVQRVNYAYYVPADANFEMGLNYRNISGTIQSLTRDGNITGIAYTGINNASVSNTFTVILDTNKPNG